MSISTRTGDEGTTSLMYGRRVSKWDARVESYGTVDELNSALGLARAHSCLPAVRDPLLKIQKHLIALMGELAVAPEDGARYREDKYPKLTSEMLQILDDLVLEMEKKEIKYEGWATPGASVASASLDLARTVCRRSERRVMELADTSGGENLDFLIIRYLNRLSDVLWLLARYTETYS